MYEIWCCKPPLGTKIHNKLEGTDYVVSDNAQFVLSGFAGEQWVIKGDKLAAGYTLLDGSEINASSVKFDKNNCWDWHKVRAKSSTDVVCACFLPQNRYTNFPVVRSYGTLVANNPAVGHGLGDFLVAPVVNGNPNIQEARVVNGLIFALTYDLRGIPKESISPAAKQVEESGAPQPASIANARTNQLRPDVLTEEQKRERLLEANRLMEQARKAAEECMAEDPRVLVQFPSSVSWDKPIAFLVGAKASDGSIDSSKRHLSALLHLNSKLVIRDSQSTFQPVELQLTGEGKGRKAVFKVFNEYRVMEHLAEKKTRTVTINGETRQVPKYVPIGLSKSEPEVQPLSAEQMELNSLKSQAKALGLESSKPETNTDFGKRIYKTYLESKGFTINWTYSASDVKDGLYRFDAPETEHMIGTLSINRVPNSSSKIKVYPFYNSTFCDEVAELYELEFDLSTEGSNFSHFVDGFLSSIKLMDGGNFNGSADPDLARLFPHIHDSLNDLPIIGLVFNRLESFCKAHGIDVVTAIEAEGDHLAIQAVFNTWVEGSTEYMNQTFMYITDSYVEFEVNPNSGGDGNPQPLKYDSGRIHWDSAQELKEAFNEVILRRSTLIKVVNNNPSSVF